MILNNKQALSFDDILLVPQYSNIVSRKEPDLTTKLTRNVSISGPIISTNMSTVTEENMLVAMDSLGSVGCLHRFLTIEEQITQVTSARSRGLKNFVLSIGVKPEDYLNLPKLLELNPTAILLDIAHGDSIMAHQMLKELKRQTSIDVIAGNIATPEAFYTLVGLGVDAVRIGIGGGTGCTTRNVTGNGMPLLQSIMDCAPISVDSGVPIIADGGIKKSGDIVKALAAGASSVCLGSMLAGTSASPGPVYYLYKDLHTNWLPEEVNGNNLPKFKKYYGMSSYTAQDKYRGGKRVGIAAEGMDKWIPYLGETEEVVQELLGAIRSGLTYQGARTIEEMQKYAEYVILTSGSMKESKH